MFLSTGRRDQFAAPGFVKGLLLSSIYICSSGLQLFQRMDCAGSSAGVQQDA